MATGDIASAAGLTVFPPTQDARLGSENDNIRGDELGEHILNGGHPLDKMTGTLPVAKGGTGSTTPAAARAALGIVASAIPSNGSNVQADIDFVAGIAAGKQSKTAPFTGPEVNVSGNVVAGGDVGAVGRLQGRASRTFVVVNSWVAAAIDANGYAGIQPSARRFKKDIAPAAFDLDAVLSIEPVRYRVHNQDDDAPLSLGFIADDIRHIVPEVVVNDADGAPLTINYASFVPVLQYIVRAQAEQLADLAERLDRATARLDALEGN